MHKPLDPTAIDPHRPWIRDQRDDPHAMNWLQVMFNPFGASPKLHFSRAWTLMFLGRVLLFIVPIFAVFVVSLAGANLSGAWKPVKFLILPIPALLVPFFIFTVATELTSWVAHARRFHEANKSGLRAIVVLIPLFLGIAGFSGGVVMGMGKYQAMNAKQATAAAPAAETPVSDTAAAPAAEASGDEAATAADAEKKPARKGGGQHGKNGPPPSERQTAIGTGTGFAIGLWAISSFFVMLWSLFYVARMPNGGVGRFKTGSDVAQGEEELRPSYAMS
ncbi:MAG: DUF805 domain-containing protein [Hyphomonas sp.]|nr:DUF805 domain-containing protein [Hyphomonas sp.]MCB9960936.1 DUF805 domain-containing protein [Hyphomonas sp.]MCB9970227.1 DUF805 domain-containing protein [Hyphomonas sp.]